MPSSRPLCSMPHVSDARDAVLPNEKSHFLVTQKLAKQIVQKASLKRRQVHVAVELVSEAILGVFRLVWQKVLCEHDATEPLITQRRYKTECSDS